MIPFVIYFSLLFIGGIIFWLLVESKVHVLFKMLMTLAFCFFTVGVFSALGTFLGWGADYASMPEKVTIIGVNIKEPNQSLGSKGSIYLTLDSIKSKYDSKFFKMYGYQTEKSEPRLFRLPYSRQLHEQLEKEVIPRLKEGQAVTGRIKKGEPGQSGKGREGKDGKGKGYDGSESLEQEYEFHNLTPGEIQQKNES